MTPERLLLGPGPSPVSARVMRAMGSPVLSHLDPEMMVVLDDLRRRLDSTFGAGAGAFSLPISGTGTAGMEAAVANVTAPGAPRAESSRARKRPALPRGARARALGRRLPRAGGDGSGCGGGGGAIVGGRSAESGPIM